MLLTFVKQAGQSRFVCQDCLYKLLMETFCLTGSPEKPSEVSGTSQIICTEVQKIFKFWLQNYLKVYTHLLLKYIMFLYLPQA